ncbi:MAG: hypothetical protein Q9227_007918 [Pyrenula ochraceoflavens]
MPEKVEHTLAQHTPSSPLSTHKPALQALPRNIDEVILGDLLLKTWYYSPYPDGIVQSSEAELYAAVTNPQPTSAINGYHQSQIPLCPRLHVCPHCFVYTPHVNHYLTHLKNHCPILRPPPTDEPDVLAEPGAPPSGTKVYEYDGYAVWEVDGETEKLYCQNLSLFGKLFLEQKSVFFDTGAFMYYVLTYTPAKAHHINSSPKYVRGKKRASDGSQRINEAEYGSMQIPQVIGFFSKEKLSWDNNNLACILIFPPFQHRQLGKLLMSVSYKLSGWEWEGGIIGGPEKPLSTMGKKSYGRFWAERVARFLLGQTRDADGRAVLDNASGRKGGRKKVRETMTVKEIGDRTGMLPEDVIVGLMHIGCCSPIPVKKKKGVAADAENRGPDQLVAEETAIINMTVMRSRVMEWMESTGVELLDAVREEGFLGEWALSDYDEEESVHSKE